MTATTTEDVMSTHTIKIENGHVQFVWSDELADLVETGETTVRRVSNVEPSPGGGWTADMGPVDGPVLGPFALRQTALDAERAWLTEYRGL